MEPERSVRQLSRGEKETETEARRLMELVEDALAIVAVHTTPDVDSLEALADRIERAARDFSVALRELAGQRRIAENAAD
jgi:truncated hemoglobin YjbI